ncbi:MAG TPA: hypothetical protein VFT16_00175 [Candidatus Saccharimonadales bacterium]|nr:hypothetical protein [Candidatus Saccharimonadales bacterium]
MMMYILAEKTTKDFKPTEYGSDLYKLCSSLEYGDVLEGEVQIWEYPSGIISTVKPDREVGQKDYYSIPDKDRWLPVLERLDEDKKRVSSAYLLLSSKQKGHHSILGHIISKLKTFIR